MAGLSPADEEQQVPGTVDDQEADSQVKPAADTGGTEPPANPPGASPDNKYQG